MGVLLPGTGLDDDRARYNSVKNADCRYYNIVFQSVGGRDAAEVCKPNRPTLGGRMRDAYNIIVRYMYAETSGAINPPWPRRSRASSNRVYTYV